jgi:hypothetical protein
MSIMGLLPGGVVSMRSFGMSQGNSQTKIKGENHGKQSHSLDLLSGNEKYFRIVPKLIIIVNG